ncbi:TPA: hypothetical protein ACTW8Y_000495 [Raoultella ornithinolytica]
MALVYSVLAGKPDSDGDAYYENIKFADDADTMEGALKIIQDNRLFTYPICRVEVTGFEAS